MRVTFLSQTGFIAEQDGRRFVMDPWLTDGAFDITVGVFKGLWM